MLAEASSVVEWGTFITTVTVGILTALLTFGAVIGQWYTMSGRMDRYETAQSNQGKVLDELAEAIKGKGQKTGIAGSVERLEQTTQRHERQISRLFKKVDGGGGTGNSGVRPALGDTDG